MIAFWRRNRKAEETEVSTGPPGPGPDEVSLLSKFSYWWLNPLIRLGAKRQLTPEDLWPIPKRESADVRTEEFEAEYFRRLNEAKAAAAERTINDDGEKEEPVVAPSINRILMKLHRRRFLFSALLMLVSQIYNVVAPSIIGEITKMLELSELPSWRGYMLVFALAFGQWLAIGLCQSHMFLIMYKIGVNARTALTSFVYRKSTLLTSSARHKLTVGEIVNLMSNDTQRYVEITQYLQQLWSGPFVIIVALVLLIRLIGVSALCGLALMVVTVPLQGKMFAWAGALRVEVMQQSDIRIKLMNEVLQGVKVIKLNAWEDSFVDKISGVRKREVRGVLRTGLLRGINFGLFSALPSIIAVVSLIVYSALGNELQADVVFPAIAYMNVLRFPLLFIPMVITQIAQLKVSAKRLTALFSAGEINEADRDWTMRDGVGESGGAEMSIKGGRFTWTNEEKADLDVIKKGGGKKKSKKPRRGCLGRPKEDESAAIDIDKEKDEEFQGHEYVPFQLQDITFEAKPGELVAIVGGVGSGKSSLVSALLGDMTREEGTVSVRGSLAYVAQSAWIFNDTLRNNIIFERDFHPVRYEKTLGTTQLLSDIDILAGGDETEIGEKGINLSGGQKQRVSIARAVYTDSDIYIFDDPLSAVDAHVADHIFKQCIMKQLRGKTRIMVTNQLQFLPYVDKIYVLKDGKIADVGTFEELNREDTSLFSIMQAYGTQLTANVTKYSASASVGEKKSGPVDDPAVIPTKHEVMSGQVLTTVEGRDHGGISVAVWLDYLRAGGGLFIAGLIILFYVLTQASNMAPDVWLTYWTSQTAVDPVGTDDRRGYFIGVYAALGVALGIFAIIRSISFALFSANASRTLHRRMLSQIMRATMTFFDTTPLGRILNRFSKDMDTLDLLLPPLLDSQLFLILSIIGIYALISAYLPWFLIGILPITFIYFVVQAYYRRTSRELQRIENVQRSPIYAHFSETLSGVSTLRAYGRVKDARDSNLRRQDDANTAFLLLQVAMRWLQFRMEIVSFFILLVVGFLIIGSRDSTLLNIDPSEAGLLLTYTLQVIGVTTFAIRSSVDLETKLTSVERISEYSSRVDLEKAATIPETTPPESWPDEGRVEFKDVQLRYRPELPLVLKGVSVTVDPLWKVGVAGRTGSGKSSLAVALFRLEELAGGSIIVDGIDISTIGLHDLRSRLGMIPQDPVIFSGTVRFNLDPFNTKTDDQLWKSLGNVQLKDPILNLEGGLDAVVAEGGDNFSLGQRQLLCIARALLRAPKILVLDEATANVDVETDALIQSTIRTEFKHCTMLTIAHRINTIMDSDRILTLKEGLVEEYGPPSELVKDPDSLFGSLVGRQAGAGNEKK